MTDRDPAVLDALERTRPGSSHGADWEDVLRRTTTAQDRRTPRRLGGVMRWAPGLAGGVALAVVLGVVAVRQGSAPRVPSAAPPGVTGVEILVRVTSIREGQSDDAAAERMERVLTDRARIQGITGFAIARSGGQLSVFLPRTHDPDWARDWIPAVPGLRIVDDGTAGKGSPDAALVLGAAGVRAAEGKPAVYYSVLSTPGPADDSISGPYATPARAQAAAARMGAGGRVMAVRASVVIDVVPEGRRVVFRAYRRELIPPGLIRAVTTDRTGLVLHVAPADRPAFEAGLGGSGTPPVLKGSLSGGPRLPVTMWDRYSGRAEVPMGDAEARATAYRDAGGQADALSAVVRATPVGPEPPRPGRRVALPAGLRPVSDDPGGGLARLRPETFRRVVSVASPRGTWWIWSARTADGWEAAGAVSAGSVGLGPCPIDPARPSLSVCGGDWENPRGTRLLFGRAGGDVRSVTVVSRDGRRTEAVVRNGFYVAAVPIRSGHLREVIARDATGTEAGRITRKDPVWGLSL